MAKTVRTMLVIIAVIVAIAALGAGGYWYLHLRSHAPKRITAAQLQALRVDLPENTTNLKDGLIQFTVSLEASDAATKKEIADLLPSVQDAVNNCMRNFTKAQLQNATGVKDLKQAIMQAVDGRLPTGKVTNVYFSTIVVQ
ncbi:MAG: flagellar basal body-associated FliL family protein [Alicyclobacillus sp.]|nr:flagellar basal body-associated FliL family protein [Alicyclobacillus sp.]